MTLDSARVSGEAPPPDHLAEVVRVRAAAEAAEVRALLAADDEAHRQAAEEGSALRRQLHVRAARVEIAITAGLSEAQLRARLAQARAVREQLPLVWSAAGEGVLDGYRVHLIADTLGRLTDDVAVERLDERVVPYAQSHTTVELKAWLRRFLARAEPEAHAERAQRAREDRQVSVRHGEDGMSELWALLPTLQAAAIDARLQREAKRFPADDERTLAQRRADLLAAWTTAPEATSGHGQSRPTADVAVVVTQAALEGRSEEPVVSSDGQWLVPASELRDLLDDECGDNLFWHRLLTDPAGQVLDHTYLGRFAPDVLARAIRFRDGVCQVPGCTIPAQRCDLDHRVSWPEGATSGDNLWPLCRTHHILKSHGFLTPVSRDGPDGGRRGVYAHRWRLPSGKVVAAERIVHTTDEPAPPTPAPPPATPPHPVSRIEAYFTRLVRGAAASSG